MKHAISIIAIAGLSACSIPTTPPPSQPLPSAINTYPAETEITDEQLAKQLYWYRDENNQKEVEKKPTLEQLFDIELEEMETLFANQTPEDWDKITTGIKKDPTPFLKTIFLDSTRPAFLEALKKKINNEWKPDEKPQIGLIRQGIFIELIRKELKRRGILNSKENTDEQ